MSLTDQLTALYARRRFGIKPGVERVQKLLERLGNPHKSYRTIHVVGTNGKGSTSAFLSSILSSSSLRTGLFTSPHLVQFSERFRINGIEISELKLYTLIQAVLNVAPEDATFFEIITAMAALYFAQENVDIAVMEAGMGGHSDATSAFEGFLTLVTPISLDHTDYLGKTVQEIAIEKVAIAPENSLAIIGKQIPQVCDAITSYCFEKSIETFWVDTAVYPSWNDDGTFDYIGINVTFRSLTPGVTGHYQLENAALALLAADCLISKGWQLKYENIRNGIANASWPGRMELISGEPPILLDGAHNFAGMKALSLALDFLHQYSRILLVFGIMEDKDLAGIISVLPKKMAACYCVTPQIERAMNSEQLKSQLEFHGIESYSCQTVKNGLAQARKDAKKGDVIVVCGSLFTVGEVKSLLAGKQFEAVRG